MRADRARAAAGDRQGRPDERPGADARLIIADEPERSGDERSARGSANLDEANAIRVAELLAQRASEGTCIVCSTHDASVTARASTVIAMRDGRVAPGAGGHEAPHAIA